MLDAGMFRLMLPRSLGGVELELPTYVTVVEELARADASVAWCVGQANGLCNYIAYADPAAARSVFAGGRTILANGPGEGNRPGRAEPARGGLPGHGQVDVRQRLPARDVAAGDLQRGSRTVAERQPDQRLMLVPKSSVTEHDVWHVSGLRGTGSQSFSRAG